MITHSELWGAIDALAARHGLTPSGLARRAGLDPTTFNRSKRAAPDGRQRWPSTESVAKILDATGCSLGDFVALVGEGQDVQTLRRVPVIGYAQAGAAGFFDDAGYPTGTGWDELLFPSIDDPQAYALEITGDSMMPVYRDGDVVLVSPKAGIRRADRVIVRTTGGEVMAKELSRQTATRVELGSLNPAHPPRTLPPREIAWMARIVWVTQ